MSGSLTEDWDLESSDGDKFRLAWLDLSEPNAAYVLTGSEGYHLTSKECREAAERLIAFADRWDRNWVAHYLMNQTKENQA